VKIIAYADVGERHVSLASHAGSHGQRYTVVVLNKAARDLEAAEVFSSYIIAAGTYLLHIDRLCGRVE
jgi:hypothetical protein